MLSTQLIKPSYSNFIESLTRLSRQEWLQQAEISKWSNHKLANFINGVVPYSVFRADRLSFKTKMPGSNVNKDQNYQETFWHGWVHLLRCQIITFFRGNRQKQNKTKNKKRKEKEKDYKRCRSQKPEPADSIASNRTQNHMRLSSPQIHGNNSRSNFRKWLVCVFVSFERLRFAKTEKVCGIYKCNTILKKKKVIRWTENLSPCLRENFVEGYAARYNLP